MRLRAIFCCLYFGIVPWWIYEPTCHYEKGYWKHLQLNLEMAMIWLLYLEEYEDLEFESKVNASWTFVASKMFRWQQGSQNKAF